MMMMMMMMIIAATEVLNGYSFAFHNAANNESSDGSRGGGRSPPFDMLKIGLFFLAKGITVHIYGCR